MMGAMHRVEQFWRHSAGRIRRVLTERPEGTRVAGSPAEVELLACLRSFGVEPPERQHRIDLGGGWAAVVDLAWPQRLLAAEWDGADTHAGAQALAYDLERQNAIFDLGWSLRRYTGGAVRRDPRRVATQLARALATSRAAA